MPDLDAGTKIALKSKKSGDFERFLLPQDASASWGYFLTLKFFGILQIHSRAEHRSVHLFGSLDKFEPAKCIF